jgi:2-keto-4-pentenoate hydratase/2-oxohepta-3-ene-1,7-dioic acid hydratase in catechol pathway
MKLTTFEHRGATAAGAIVGEHIVDLRAALPSAPATLSALLSSDASARSSHLQELIDSGAHRLELGDVRLLAPIPRPGKLLAIGLNYKDHIAETGLPTPEHPTVFNKQSTCVIGPAEGIHLPKASAALDYEGELAVVIGKRCRHVPREQAQGVIAGYCIANDVSVRDVQLRTPQWTLGKSFDTHGPLGPWLTTPDEVGDPHALSLRTFVNGELRQQSNTRELLFDCYALVELLSSVCTLEPGDVISTGTPGGVGMAMQPATWLKPGDVVRIEIDKLGALENPVLPEPESTVVY